MPQFPGFIGGSYTPVSYRADVERTVNLYPEIIESKHGPNVGFLRRRPKLSAFLSSTVNPTQAAYLVQGAGAGGGGDDTNVTGGGGGGGGETHEGTVALTVQSYPVVVGVGGAGGMAIGVAGSESSFNGVTSDGGSPGGGGGANGGSGAVGGGGGGDDSTTSGTGGTGTTSTGGAGGSNGGGGGGGSRGNGANGPGFNTGGNGGAGLNSSISGTPTGYGGGGGGGAYATPGTNAYGGGTGATLTGAGGNATANTGGGGGGGRFGFDGGDGADGVVVISYPTDALTATGGTITVVGGQTIHTFVADGTFEVTAVQPAAALTAALAVHYCPAQGRCFFVTSNGLLTELFSDATTIVRGTVPVGPLLPTMADNGTGHQLIVVSDSTLSLLDLDTNGVSVISANVIADPVLCAYSDGYFLLLNQTGTLQWSASFDGTTWDALDIAKNSATADPWVSLLVNHRELWLVGTQTGQVWVDSGATDAPFELVQGSVFHQGLIAPYTLQRCDNSNFWVGQNEQGRCVVFRASGYTPQRISTHPVELALGSSDNLENAVSTVFQSQGHTFYAIYVTDLETTWVFDVSTEVWTEWAILVDDTSDPWVWRPWPVQASTFAFGENLVVAQDASSLVAKLVWE